MINQTLASGAFNLSGLDAIGIASGQLASLWATDNSEYNSSLMTLTLAPSAKWKAMTGGIVQWSAFGAKYLTDASGNALNGVVGVLKFHPQAALRLRRLIGSRYDGRTDGFANRPVPFYVALRDGAPPDIVNALAGVSENDAPLPPIMATIGTEIGHGILTFHDEQGLIIDPIAVASLYRDLILTFNALLNESAGSIADLTNLNSGTIGSIASKSSGFRLHLIDPFGNSWQDDTNKPGLRFSTNARFSQNLIDWPDGQNLNLTNTTGTIRFGFSPEGSLGSIPIPKPAFPATEFPAGSDEPVLNAQFFRAIVVDLKLHLTGNRSNESSESVPGVDESSANEIAPVVREGDDIQFLFDGQTVMGAVNEVSTSAGLKLAVSPIISGEGTLPTSPLARWPTFPSTSETASDFNAEASRLARTTGIAGYADDTADVVVTWPADTFPPEAHVRIFPRVDPGPVIVPLSELDFARRGDGAAGIVHSTAAFSLLLKDPFNSGINPRPSTPTLRFDLIVVTRNVSVKSLILGGFEIKLGDPVATPPIESSLNTLDGIPLNQKAIAPSPILGLVPTVPATGTDPVLNALGEASPREAPRFRTMSRNDSIVAGHDGNDPGNWNAVLTSGWLHANTLRGDARLGNPGNQAGPEEYSPGISTNGLLAHDLARFALRRTHHLLRRLPELNNSRWNLPAAGTGPMVGAVLQNIPDTVESPELKLIPDNIVSNLPSDWDDLVTAVSSFLPSSLSTLTGMIPVPGAGTRWVEEIKREAMSSKSGRRDSQWALRWALSKARKLVYLESPLLGATSTEDEAHQLDLVKLLKNRLEEAPDLRVIIALPKRIPFGPGYESFAQRFYLSRNQAITLLQSAAPKRVVAYQPIGFPGRPEIVRGTLVIVDDVWSLTGASSFSRRGLTFDGSLDIAAFDNTIKNGVSRNVHLIRKQAMARILNLTPPSGSDTASANWVRLSQPQKAFDLIREILERGGDGLIEPLWSGLPETELPALDKQIADPEGRNFSAAIGLFANELSGIVP